VFRVDPVQFVALFLCFLGATCNYAEMARFAGGHQRCQRPPSRVG